MLRREADEKHELQISIKEMALRLGDERSDMMIGSSLHVLDREGYIDRFDIPGRRVRGTRLLQPDVRGPQLELDAAKLREKERRDRAKLKMMIDFAYGRECRQQAILRYFGESDPARCGNCDICLQTVGTSPGADGRRSARCPQGAERRRPNVGADRGRMAAALWTRPDRADARGQPFARNHPGPARSAFDLRIASKAKESRI